MSGMEPALIGAAIGGGGAAITGKNPFQGALLGGLTGGIGGSMMGAGSTSPFSIGSVLNGIGTNFAAGGDPVKGAAMNAAALAGSGGGGESFIGGGFEPSLSGFGQGIMEAAQGANQWANQNPITAQLGIKAASSLMQPHPVQFSQPGQVHRGQIPQMDYSSLLNPQQQTVLRPQAMSLL